MPKPTRKKVKVSPPSSGIFQLRVELREVSPPVWRRLLVPSNISLAELHVTLNETMGWTNSHLHQFVLRDRTFGDPESDEDGELELEDEGKVRLEDLLGVGQSLNYEYDLGDGWQHTVKVEKALGRDEHRSYPLCIGGARACPPEDCGGPMGYERLLNVLENEDDDEHNDTLQWLGGFFDPEGFDVNRTNVALRERLR